MESKFQNFLLFVSVSVGYITGECDEDTGPAGSPECVLLNPYYSKHQWSTCLTNQYMHTYSKGAHFCRNNYATYCYYQCMLEIHNIAEGPVYDDCACGPDASSNRTSQPTMVTPAIPDWCFSPSGDECSWYRDCLEKRYPCKESGNSYALDYAEKFCNLYQQHYSDFDNAGQQWINGVRKCLQVTLVPILRPYEQETCEQIKEKAFDSHPGCYTYPDKGAPSICDIGLLNWAKVFWTVKSAFIQAPLATFKQMIIVKEVCNFKPYIDGMKIILLHFKQAKNSNNLQTLDEFSETVSNTLSEKLDWNKEGIMNFGYPSTEYNKLNDHSADNSTDESTVYINVLLAARSQFDLNANNSPTVNVSAAAIDVAKAIEKGDVRLDTTEGMEFTRLSVCVDYNCAETSLKVTPAPPEENSGSKKNDGVRGLPVMAVVIGVYAVTFVLAS